MTVLLPLDDRPAPHPGLHPLLASRWSPRSFDPDAELDGATAELLLEAARWAPSASNSQPWRFILAPRGTEAHDKLAGALVEFNRAWAASASALLLIAARTVDDNGNAQRWATYDAGQAAALLTAQAEHDGWSVHQMGGFDQGAARAAFDLPEDVTPIAVAAIGRRAGAHLLPDHLAERETAPRSRRPLAELLLPGSVLPGSVLPGSVAPVADYLQHPETGRE
jgi:nitroreductase